MKRLFSYLFLFLVVGIVNLATPAQSKGIGKGTLYMSDTAIRKFHTYIKLQSKQKLFKDVRNNKKKLGKVKSLYILFSIYMYWLSNRSCI